MIVGRHTYEPTWWKIQKWNFNDGDLFVGSFCSIGPDVEFFLGGNHRIDRFTTYPFGHRISEIFDNFDGNGHPYSNGDIVIGNDVWIGDGATILSGVNISDGSVIGAKSLVTKNIGPYEIWGGNPAKLIRKRFDDETINFLLDLKWWNFSDEKINSILPYLCNTDILKLKDYLNL